MTRIIKDQLWIGIGTDECSRIFMFFCYMTLIIYGSRFGPLKSGQNVRESYRPRLLWCRNRWKSK